jgi:hypothetical protein
MPTRRTFLKWLLAGSAAVSLPLLLRLSRRPGCSLADLGIIPRAEWGAAEPDHTVSGERGIYHPITNREGWLVYQEPLEQVLTTIVVHHSALPLSDGPREIQRLHMMNRGFADIGYHFVIDGDGGLYEGRPLNVRGAHTSGRNTGTVGIALMGNFENGPPPPAQLVALQTLAGCLVAAYEITHLAGHRDFQPGVTVCPGQFLEPILPGLAAGLGLVFGTAGYDGPV